LPTLTELRDLDSLNVELDLGLPGEAVSSADQRLEASADEDTPSPAGEKDEPPTEEAAPGAATEVRDADREDTVDVANRP